MTGTSAEAEGGCWRRARRFGTTLCFATVAVNQICCRTGGKPNLWAALERVAILDRRRDHTGSHKAVKLARWRSADRARWDKFGDHAPTGSNDHSLSRLDSTDITAQVIPQLADARLHICIVATCGPLAHGGGSACHL